jgi:Butirosin biosynthesis protein H, N-terminal
MLPYIGSGDYCFSNSLHMSLLGSGAPPDSLPPTSFIECLTTMPFGYTYFKEAELFFFSGPNPDLGLTRAIETLGWTCKLEHGGDEGEALARLRAAVQQGPVLIGPLNMGDLTYNPNHSYLVGADHYVVVMGFEEDHVLLHDPKGFPSAALPVEELLKAWRADRLDLEYTDEPYTMRTAFRPIQASSSHSRRQMIERTLPQVAANLRQELWKPGLYGGIGALRMLVETFRTQVPNKLAVHLFYWAVPIGLRHKVDAQLFLREGNQPEAAEIIEQQARLLGQAQYAGVQHSWSQVAALIEQVAGLEEQLLAVTESW